MAILEIEEMKGEGCRLFHWSTGAGRDYTRKFRVVTDGWANGPRMVLEAIGVTFGDTYAPAYAPPAEADPQTYVDDIAIEPEGEDGIYWIVTIHYGWFNAFAAGGGPEQNPLLMPIDVSWSFRDHESVLDVDVNGQQVVNSAGDPFDPPVVIDDPRLMMTVVRNEAVFNIAWVVAYRNAVNSDPFAGFAPLFCKVLNISAQSPMASRRRDGTIQVTYEFEFLTSQINNNTTNGFRPACLLSQGFRALSSVTGKPYQITLRGQPINAPATLDSSGFYPPSGPVPYFIVYQAYPELPFSVFNFSPTAISRPSSDSGRGYPDRWHSGARPMRSPTPRPTSLAAATTPSAARPSGCGWASRSPETPGCTRGGRMRHSGSGSSRPSSRPRSPRAPGRRTGRARLSSITWPRPTIPRSRRTSTSITCRSSTGT